MRQLACFSVSWISSAIFAGSASELGTAKQTKIWDKVIVDRSTELMSRVNVCQRATRRGVSTYVYVNNHYAGFPPATVERVEKLWKAAT